MTRGSTKIHLKLFHVKNILVFVHPVSISLVANNGHGHVLNGTPWRTNQHSGEAIFAGFRVLVIKTLDQAVDVDSGVHNIVEEDLGGGA